MKEKIKLLILLPFIQFRVSSIQFQISFISKGVAMKKCVLLMGIIMVLFTGLCFAQAPHEIAGITLNTSIKNYSQIVKENTDLPIRFREYLREAEIKNLEGFKSGLILYGECTNPGRIIRIKLKYRESTRRFYDTLLKKFKQRFGEPTEWRGDPFHIVIAWKWSFTDKDGNKISLNLQHNNKDTEEKIGNSVKLTMTSAIEEERRCYEKKHPEKADARNRKKSDKSNWDRYVPR
jgi:hypothetical protein